MENERALWAIKRVRQGDETRRVATTRERIDYVSSRIAGAAARKKTEYAGVAELADAQDLGSCVYSCRFKSCHPYQSAVPTANVAVSTAEFLCLEPDGKVCYEHSYKKALAERCAKLAVNYISWLIIATP